MSQTNKPYPSIFRSGTDYDLPRCENAFEKYTDFKELGSGGSGVLYSCYDQYMGRRVVMKRLPREQADDTSLRRRFLREARITAQLQHPNTPPVYEVGLDDEGQLYFSMKKIEGRNLFRIIAGIAQGKEEIIEKFTLKRLLNILNQTCQSLYYAHTHGVIHRDVKPENIMIGMFSEVILMDWGVAKVWGQHDDEAQKGSYVFDRLTSAGQRPGTPLYMSPEQVTNSRPVDARTDIFSMGVTLYEVLAQREPFRGQNIQETFANIVDFTPDPPSSIAKHFEVPEVLDDACMKAIEKDPADRHENIFELAETFRIAAEQMPE
ncbi:MAG: serine/threonine-protein kinase [Planctomycetota bacterium]